MGHCIYCGQKAGFLKKEHKECLAKYLSGNDQIEGLVTKSILETGDFAEMTDAVNLTAREHFVKPAELYELVIREYDHAVVSACHDHLPLSKEQETKLVNFQNYFKYTQDQLNRNRSSDLLAKSSIIRRFADGDPIDLKGLEGVSLPVILQKDEEIAWVYPNTKLFQTTVKTEYAGRSNEVSIKLAKGVYYRAGAFKGHPIATQQLKEIASGMVFITTKNIHFSSPVKSLKIPHNKIISIYPYMDAVSIQKDGASSKPFIFQGVEEWFIQNIVANANLK